MTTDDGNIDYSKFNRREQADDAESSDDGDTKYSTVWERIAAQLIDGLIIMLPFFAIGAWIGSESRSYYTNLVVVSIFINLWFNVYLIKRYGGTPGKLFMNLRIVRLDETPATYKEAMLRYVIMFLLSLSSQIALLIGAREMTDSEFASLSWIEQSARIAELAPSWYGANQMIVYGWMIALLLVLFTNKERRTLHDYIAGTVVIRSGQGVM